MMNNTTQNSAVETNVQHLIEIQNIGKDYQEGESTVQAIKEMTFYIDDGEFVSIMGQSGSGKSTMLSILGGLNHPTRGRILLDALDIYKLSSEQRADLRSEYIGIIFQSFQHPLSDRTGKREAPHGHNR